MKRVFLLFSLLSFMSMMVDCGGCVDDLQDLQEQQCAAAEQNVLDLQTSTSDAWGKWQDAISNGESDIAISAAKYEWEQAAANYQSAKDDFINMDCP